MNAVVTLALMGGLLVLPGLPFGFALGLRGWAALGTAPVLTLGVIFVAATVLRLIGQPWRPTEVGVLWLVAALLALASARAWTWRPTLQVTTRAWLPALTLAASGSLGASVVWRASGGLNEANQVWDAMFHSNAIRLIADSGDSQMSALSAVAKPAVANFYYPNTFHLVGALGYDVWGAGVVSVVNALAASLPLVFGLSIIGVLAAFRAGTTTLVFAPVVAVAASSFPYGVLGQGPLLPFATAIAAAPGLLALTEVLGLGASRRVAVLAGLAAAGVASTHPSVAVLAALWCGTHLVFSITVRRRRPRGLALSTGLVIVVGLLASAALVRPLLEAGGEATIVNGGLSGNPVSALGRVILFYDGPGSVQVVLAALTVVGGLLCLWRKEMWSSLVIAGLLALLYTCASTGRLTSVTALWWGDPARFAALYVMPITLLAAHALGRGAEELARLVMTKLQRRSSIQWVTTPRHARALSLVVVLAAVVVTTNGLYQQHQVYKLAGAYTDGPTVSRGELFAYAFLAAQPDHGAVLNDPQDGSAYAYAIDGVQVLFKAPLTPPYSNSDFGKDRLLLYEHFNELQTNAEVAAAADRLQVRWVIVGAGLVPGSSRSAPGLQGLDSLPSLRKVFDDGAAQVYQIDSSLTANGSR